MKERKVLGDFIKEMQSKLDANAHKGHWMEHMEEDYLTLLKEEIEELEEVLGWIPWQDSPESAEQNLRSAMKECADVANFAMMIWDILRFMLEDLKGEFNLSKKEERSVPSERSEGPEGAASTASQGAIQEE